MWKSRCLGILPLAIVEPTTSVLVYPLIADLYSRSSLALECHAFYVTFVFVLKMCITFSSLVLLHHSIKHMIRFITCAGNDNPSGFNQLYLVSVIWNALFSYIVIFIGMRNDEMVEMTSEDCFLTRTDDSIVWTGLKTLIPQCLVLCVMTLLVVALLTLKRSPGKRLEQINSKFEMMNSQHEDITRKHFLSLEHNFDHRQQDYPNIQGGINTLQHNCKNFKKNFEIHQHNYEHLQDDKTHGHKCKTFQEDFKSHQSNDNDLQSDFKTSHHNYNNHQNTCTNLQGYSQNLQHDTASDKHNSADLQHDQMDYECHFRALQHDLDSSGYCLWSVVKPIVLTIAFQCLYFGVRFSFQFCSCGWFRLLSKITDTLTLTCLIKSIIVVVMAVCAQRQRGVPQSSHSAFACNIV